MDCIRIRRNAIHALLVGDDIFEQDEIELRAKLDEFENIEDWFNE